MESDTNASNLNFVFYHHGFHLIISCIGLSTAEHHYSAGIEKVVKSSPQTSDTFIPHHAFVAEKRDQHAPCATLQISNFIAVAGQ